MSTGEKVLWTLLIISILLAVGVNFFAFKMVSDVKAQIDQENQNIRELKTRIAVIQGHRDEINRIKTLLNTIGSKVVTTDEAKKLLANWENRLTRLTVAYTISVGEVKALTSWHESVSLGISARTEKIMEAVETLKAVENATDKWLEISTPPVIQKTQGGYTVSMKVFMPYKTDKVDNLWDLK